MLLESDAAATIGSAALERYGVAGARVTSSRETGWPCATVLETDRGNTITAQFANTCSITLCWWIGRSNGGDESHKRYIRSGDPGAAR